MPNKKFEGGELGEGQGTGKFQTAEEALADSAEQEARLVPLEHPEEEEARELFGNNFFGSREVEQMFGLKEQVPPIPFSRLELEDAALKGYLLVLYVSEGKRTGPITLETLQKTFPSYADGRIAWFQNESWCDFEDFYKKEKPRIGWRLVQKTPLPVSLDSNYFEQTKQIFALLQARADQAPLPKKFREALREFQKALPTLEAELAAEDPLFGEKLTELAINKFFRETAVEVVYRLFLMNTLAPFPIKEFYVETGTFNHSQSNTNSAIVGIGSIQGRIVFTLQDGAGVEKNSGFCFCVPEP